MAEVGSLAVRIASFLDDKGFKDTSKQLNNLNGWIDKNQAQFKKLGLVAGAAAGALTYGFVKSIQAASKLEETTGKFNTVFRGVSKMAAEMSADLVASYGVSTEQSRRYLSSVQDLLVPMGMQRESAAKLSGEIVKLSSDLGSFNNLPTEQVMMDIQSALVGNFETMKKYGVVLNATAVEQAIMNSGIVKSKDDITQAMKAQAAYNLIVAGSGDAMGDFARTQGSFANQMKITRARIDDIIATLGTKLMPIAMELVGIIQKDILPLFTKWTAEMGGAEKIARFFGDTLKFLIKIILGVVDGFQLWGDALAVQMLAMTGHFKAAKIGFQELGDKVVKMGDQLRALSEEDIDATRTAKEEKTLIHDEEFLANEERRRKEKEKEDNEQKERIRKAEQLAKLRKQIAKEREDEAKKEKEKELKAEQEHYKLLEAEKNKHLKIIEKYSAQTADNLIKGTLAVANLQKLTWSSAGQAYKEMLKGMLSQFIAQQVAEITAAKIKSLAVAIMNSTITWGSAAWQIGAVLAAHATAIGALRAIPSLDNEGIVPGPAGKPVIIQALGGEKFLGRNSVGKTGTTINVTVTGNNILDDYTAEILASKVGNKLYELVETETSV